MSSSSSKNKQRRVSLLEKYKIMGRISTDGDGEVFREVEKKTDQEVAVKKYSDERQLKEIAYLKKLNCPFVLPVLDVGHDQGRS
ncbi:hypothetical protein M0R45_014503 [Rubus argutus]|uniref:Protein kinase domain-containing protein n=1 Tax=Rubus argutus TaxID=59490 RepID=A0AAW1XMU6_RUBAR